MVNALTARAWSFKSEVLRQKYTPSCRGDICTYSLSHSRTCTMSCDQSYPFPQVFLVDGHGGSSQHSAQQPNLVPCWSFPPPQERVKSRGKSRGFMGVSPCLAMIVLMLFLLVFAALGFEAFQIYKMQMELKEMKKVRSHTECDAYGSEHGKSKRGNMRT